MAKFDPNKDGITYLFGGGFDESVIKLSISSETLDPKKISKVLHTQPTKAYKKGDVSGNGKRIMNHGKWELATPWISNLEFEDNLAQFLAKLPSNKRVWSQLANDYECTLGVVLRMRTWNRGGTLSSDVICALAARKLELNFDIYFEDDEKLWSEKVKLPNQSSDPMLSSGTSRAGHEPRHP